MLHYDKLNELFSSDRATQLESIASDTNAETGCNIQNESPNSEERKEKKCLRD